MGFNGLHRPPRFSWRVIYGCSHPNGCPFMATRSPAGVHDALVIFDACFAWLAKAQAIDTPQQPSQ